MAAARFEAMHVPLHTPAASRPTPAGVKDVPGFAFYEDGQAIFDVLLNYTTAVLGTYYPGEANLAGDAQLQVRGAQLSNCLACAKANQRLHAWR